MKARNTLARSASTAGAVLAALAVLSVVLGDLCAVAQLGGALSWLCLAAQLSVTFVVVFTIVGIRHATIHEGVAPIIILVLLVVGLPMIAVVFGIDSWVTAWTVAYHAGFLMGLGCRIRSGKSIKPMRFEDIDYNRPRLASERCQVDPS
jgi:hypothetical protein